jgi:2-oxoglutarate dehydrogenase E2 component (dihydrolipoamide succinyltransferase)
MPVELVVPSVGESITEVEIGDWLKNPGEQIHQDEPVVVIETEKVTVELPAPASGTLTTMLKHKGDKAAVGDVIGYMEPDGTGTTTTPAVGAVGEAQGRQREASRGEAQGRQREASRGEAQARQREASGNDRPEGAHRAPVQEQPKSQQQPPQPKVSPPAREEQVIPMTPIRRRIAERLVEAQKSAALLTTFNEIDMSAVLALRKQHQETFQAKYNIKLGLMSFFVKATIEALKMVPQLNAEVRGHDIVYHNYHDIGIAVGGGKGLVVPVLRNAERMSFAEIETAIADFANRAQANQLKVDELQGGTFTISNGGVYGSMLSTPIVNPPQSGVLGLHAIEDRPMARDGAVVIRPMMYVALTYDHRIVDGREAVTCLKRIKEIVEDPARMLLEI